MNALSHIDEITVDLCDNMRMLIFFQSGRCCFESNESEKEERGSSNSRENKTGTNKANRRASNYQPKMMTTMTNQSRGRCNEIDENTMQNHKEKKQNHFLLRFIGHKFQSTGVKSTLLQIHNDRKMIDATKIKDACQMSSHTLAF